MTSTAGFISSGTYTPFSKHNLFSTTRSSLDPCSSRLSFTTQLPTSRFPLKKTSSKPARTIPIMASAAVSDGVYLNSKSFYDLLGVSETGTLSEIKKAYKQLARKYHPDVSPPDTREEYTKQFIQVQEAYETLSDPERRALYDRDLSKEGLDLRTIFSDGKRRSRHQAFEDRYEWEQRWQSQLAELMRKSNCNAKNNNIENMSWAAKMRRQNCYSN